MISMLLHRLTSPVGILCWLFISVAGVAAFWKYELSPGEQESIAVSWPESTTLTASSHQATLLMFVHPQCNCTTAGLHELQQLLKELEPTCRPELVFVLMSPNDEKQDWRDTANERFCRKFREASIVLDPGGREADLFGVSTSGTCLLYSGKGELIFSGGINASRGHIGPNRGRDLLKQCLASKSEGRRNYVAFGCPLTAPKKGERF